MNRSLKQEFSTLLPKIINNPSLHARWLNTLSYLENCGARKMAACEHPTKVKEEMLKHAAEEFRHAHTLKKQMHKVVSAPPVTYEKEHLLGGIAALNYLKQLDLLVCKYLKKKNLGSKKIKEGAYILVTYAIELRAKELYPLYHHLLKERGSKVGVKAILLEEEKHLQEISQELEKFEGGFEYAKDICKIESTLCKKWVEELNHDLN